jgi:hypothetical protein
MGKGVFATGDIQLGEIIFAERPLLVVPRSLLTTTNLEDLKGSYSVADRINIPLFKKEQQL